MQKIFLLLFIFCCTTVLQAQVSYTVDLTAAGTLKEKLTDAGLLTTVTNLTITGNIDARDFNTLNKDCVALTNIDLGSTTIVAYTGTEGTNGTTNTSYIANEVPINSFYNKPNIVSVKLPSTTTSIGSYVLKGCWSITSIDIPMSVNTINDYAFSNCWVLSTINLPTSLTTIKNDAFSNLYNLTTVTIPASVTLIAQDAFSGSSGDIIVDSSNPSYSSLDGVLYNKSKTKLLHVPTSKKGDFTIPTTVTNIAPNAFFNVTLGNISIPAATNTIDYLAFSKFGGYFIVDDNNTQYSSIDGVLCNKAKTEIICFPCSRKGSYTTPTGITSIEVLAFEYCNLSEVILSPGVNSIGLGAFSSSMLKTISLPSTLNKIENQAFMYCYNLNAIYVNNTTPIVLSQTSQVFSSVNTSACNLFVPAGTKNAYSSATLWKDFVNINEGDGLVVPSTIKMVATSGTKTFDIYSNVTCSLSSDASWLTLNPTSITGNGTVTLAAEANVSINSRVATITVNGVGVASQTITVTQAGATPTLSLSAASVSIGKEANSTATNEIICNTNWSATVNASWLALSPTYGSGNGEMTFTAEANPTISTRTATVTITAIGAPTKTFTVTQASGDPSLSVSTTNTSIAKTTNSQAMVNITSNTSWSATNDASWLTLSTTSSTGNATLTFTAEANPTISTRVATVTVSATGVASQSITVTQAAGNAIISVSATTVTIGKSANSTASVNVTSNTTWNITVNETWLTSNISTATGNATLTITAEANPLLRTRYATVRISETGGISKSITVSQLAGDLTLSVSATSVSIAKTAYSTASANVTSNTTWNVAIDTNWLTSNIKTSTGNAKITFYARANNTTSTRSATVTISAPGLTSQTVILTQEAGDEDLFVSLSATSAFLAQTANSSASVDITSNTTWNVSNNATWLITDIINSSGNQTLTIYARANKTTSQRSAIVTISSTDLPSQTITVTQEAGDATLSVSANSAIISNIDGSNGFVNITSNTTWTATDDATWLTINPTDAINNGILTFTAEANNTADQRIATITISAPGVASKTVVITQEADIVTSVEKQDANYISIFPNPTSEGFTISDIEKPTQLTIIDFSGHIVHSQKVENKDYVNISHLKSGIYLVNVDGNRIKVVKK